MSTTVPATTLDLSKSGRVPFLRLTRVELRKMLDTLAGLWLTIAIVAVTVLVLVIWSFNEHDKTFVNAMQASAIPQGILLPVLGIMLITSEWGQRTAMNTFTLEPRRSKVLAAKVVAAVLVGVASVVVTMAVASLVTAVGGADDPWHGVGVRLILQYLLLEVLGVVGGLVFGLLLLNTAAAIVLSFVLPIAFSVLTTLVRSFHKAQPWVDPGTSQQPLQLGLHLTGREWAQLLVSSLIWVVLPFVVGLWRVLRAEVK